MRLLAFPRASVEFAETTVAVSRERSHAARLAERQRRAIALLGSAWIEPFAMVRYVGEKMAHDSRVPGTPIQFEAAATQALRIIKPAKRERRAAKLDVA